MTREEENRELARWLEYPCQCGFLSEQHINGGACGYYTFPDFYRDEAANALLLEKMRKPLLVSDWPGCEGWRVDIGVAEYGGKPIGPTCADRKEAICQAALQRIERGEK